MFITTFFTKDGVPDLTLSPVINIVNLTTDTIAVSNGNMVHKGFGIYAYDVSSFYDNSQEYAWRCDGGVTLGIGERYSFGVNDFVNIEEMSDELDDSSGSVG